MWEAIVSFVYNYSFLAAVAASLIAQLLKFVINAIVNREFKVERLHGDGGMPSAHTATVIALATVVGYTEGWDSAVFAVSLILAVVVMHDAVGVRRETGKQAEDIGQLFAAINDMLGEKDKIEQKKKLKTLVGHTHLQVFFGAVTGILVAVLFIAIFIH